MAKFGKGPRARKYAGPSSTSQSSQPKASSPGPYPSQNGGADELHGDFVEASTEYWRSDGFTVDHWSTYVDEHIQPWHEHILTEFRTSADTCVDRYHHFRKRHEWWRRCVIITTGTVAILNAVAALLVSGNNDFHIFGWTVTASWISITAAALAAIAASVLAVLANLENFGNYIEQAHAHREARELYLDAAREAEYLWQSHVVAFSGRPEACVNARELYRRLCEKDRELRRKVKDLTQPRATDGGG